MLTFSYVGCMEPISRFRDHHPFLDVSFFTGFIKCVVQKECYDSLVECRLYLLHHPAISCKRGYSSNQYRLSYNSVDHFWERCHSHVLCEKERSVSVTYQWESIDHYMNWYLQISHPVI